MEETQNYGEVLTIPEGATTLIKMPKFIGCYDIAGDADPYGSVRFYRTKKPIWLHRFFCRLLLGWKWVDEEK